MYVLSQPDAAHAQVKLSAVDWVREGHRVLRDGQSLSLMSRAPVDWDFMMTLNEMLPMAELLVRDGQGDELLAATFVGVENFGPGATPSQRGSLPYSFGWRGGERLFREFFALRKLSRGVSVFMPLGAALVDRRIVAVLPAKPAQVELAYQAFMCLLSSTPGVVLATACPQSDRIWSHSHRLLNERSLMDEMCEELLDSLDEADLDSRRVGDNVGGYLGRALRCASTRLENGLLLRGQEPVAPVLVVPKSSTKEFSQLQCIMALLTNRNATRAHRVSLWCNSCTCDAADSIVCPLMVFVRLFHLGSGRPPIWHDREHILYLPPSDVKVPVPQPSHGGSRVSTSAAPVSHELTVLNAAAAVIALLNLLSDGSTEEAREIESTVGLLGAKMLAARAHSTLGAGANHSGKQRSAGGLLVALEIEMRNSKNKTLVGVNGTSTGRLDDMLRASGYGEGGGDGGAASAPPKQGDSREWKSWALQLLRRGLAAASAALPHSSELATGVGQMEANGGGKRRRLSESSEVAPAGASHSASPSSCVVM